MSQNDSSIQEQYLCFVPGKGFAVYEPNDGGVTYTQELSAASEAPKEDWCDVITAHAERFEFLPAGIYLERLKARVLELEQAISNSQ